MTDRRTVFSLCRRYRYTLWREWEPLLNRRYVQFIGLNPSTADEVQDDPTIRRCIDFAKRWGAGALCMTNAFAWRDTDPEMMKLQRRPIGALNDRYILRVAAEAEFVVAAWGKHGTHRDRDRKLLALLSQIQKPIYCLRVNDDGTPQHPLYIAASTQPIIYPGRS
ncbi:MAG TPA: DUF1643 domain-containing protein [Verrucomicrobiae bacterium]